MTYQPSPFASASGVVVYSTKNSGDTNNRYQVDSDGVASWGPGNAAVDISMSRGAADQLDLAAGDSFHVLSGHVRVAGSGGTGVAYIDLDDGSTVTAGGVGEVRFRSNAGVFEVSENGAAFAAPGGGITGSGVNNQIATWSGASTQDGSVNFTYDGTVFRVGTTTRGATNGDVAFGLSDATGNNVFYDQSANAFTFFDFSSGFAGSLRLAASSIGAARTWDFPDASGTIPLFATGTVAGDEVVIWSGTSGIQARSTGLTFNSTTGMVINEAGGSGVDIRWESANSTNGLFCDAGAARIVMQKDNGALPALGSNTVLVLAQTFASTSNIELSLISGANGNTTINLGTTGDENITRIDMDHNINTLTFFMGGVDFLHLDGASGPIVFNESGNSTLGVRIEGGSLQRLFATNASAATEAIIFLTDTAPNLQTMDRGVYWGTVSTEPTAAPVGGAFMYVDALGNPLTMNEATEIGEPSYQERREWWWQALGDGTAADAVGMTAPTTTGTASDQSVASGAYIQYDTTASINSDAGWNGAVNAIRNDWDAVMTMSVRTGSDITSIRHWIGAFSADPMGSADPASLHIMAFRYDTVADGTAFWRCVTKDGTTIDVTTTTIAIAASTTYNLRIDARDGAFIKFYINGVLAATATTNLPGAATDLDCYAEARNLVAASRLFGIGKFHVSSR